MIKLLIGSALGLALYVSLSFYQPITEANASSQTAAAQTKFSFESPIPYDLVVSNK